MNKRKNEKAKTPAKNKMWVTQKGTLHPTCWKVSVRKEKGERGTKVNPRVKC